CRRAQQPPPPASPGRRPAACAPARAASPLRGEDLSRPGTPPPETPRAPPARAPAPPRKHWPPGALGPGSRPPRSGRVYVHARCDASRRWPIDLLIERFQEMPRRIPADSAAERGADLGAVAPVHPAPHARVAFLGMDLGDARVVADGAGVP